MEKREEKKSEKETVKLTDLPRELILLIAKELDPKSEARLGKTSTLFKKLGLGELAKEQVVKTLLNLNHHDLFFLAKENESTALIIATTPDLAEKLNQHLYGGRAKESQQGYDKSQYAEANRLDKTGKRYDYDIPDALILIGIEHPKVAAIMLDKDYRATELSEREKKKLQTALESKPAKPNI